MAKIEPKLDEFEFNKLVNQWVEEKKKSPQRINRHLTYKLYNQLFNGQQRDVNACTCMDRDTDLKVTRNLEKYLKLTEPLPIQSNVKIDFSSMTKNEDELFIFDEEVQKPKKTTRKTTKKATQSETNGETTNP
jgi:hypothetical protein